MAMTDDLRAAIKRSGLSANEIGRRAKIAPSVVSRFLAETGKTKTASLSLANADKIGTVVGWPAPPVATLVKTKYTQAQIKPVEYKGRVLHDEGRPYYEVVPETEVKVWGHPVHVARMRAARKELGLDS